ncbi:nickel-dependent hydrogenase large subunit [Thiorhodovibrio frisius]|uniref:Ni,Fe-hydrogenase I large subunit n=1 Tax=Thiorhodovibrio frisius TaxID=631362 RepID=H8Z3U8_9GAMM|nr:nickel-dependent hydrogenase large subunit [Thiorhodovibrio frisius]EIC21100.1 Ni,Fe-hydrogenase I large subunit [Thiorhodovibrio frisius]WPL22161.1 Coenzyme F420-reducing hydrogenase, alpha subunit [Thiorhodovibrio frisius]
MDDPAGRLRIALNWDSERWRVDIRSSRPLAASRVFSGKPVAEVARQIPLLYSLCATAQSQAFTAAAESILNLAPDASTRLCRQQLLHAELIKEHLWRLLLDWPPLLGLTREDALMARVMAAWQGLRSQLRVTGEPFIPSARIDRPTASANESALSALIALGEQASLGTTAADWLAACDSLEQWRRFADSAQTPAAAMARALHEQELETLGQTRTAFLTQPDLSAIEQQLSGALGSTSTDAFIAAPSIKGRCYETTPLARMAGEPLIASLMQTHGNGLLTRFAALLVELAQALAEASAVSNHAPPIQSLHPRSDTSLAAVQAARGLLVHRLVLRDGRVERHQVLAPTEWNFHPQGVLNQALSRLPPGGKAADRTEIERLADLLVTAIDPCVDYSISLEA